MIGAASHYLPTGLPTCLSTHLLRSTTQHAPDFVDEEEEKIEQ